ncbi:M20 family metallopeptidase [Spelaeicoccus albus]|uniref:Peptidase M20 domain-containing protein 2 n=1 Tax=Spelaeicoccus albus TaxID=1280376 RepID=A0A7Z0D2Y5_9MICO|nr:M20 family metallopeptidase [Spelaeicoccus albus]NYI67853.1 amidohydrolase [Spelaeicoccus albus]
MTDSSVATPAVRNELKEVALSAAAAARDEVVGLSHDMHAHPEVAFEEHRTADAITAVLSRHGFSIERGVADLPTAFVATAGSGDLTIGICAELDALPGVGHACGHNVIAGAAATAGIALAHVADAAGVTVKVFGTPAEEFGGGKIFMLNAGVFDGVHAAMMVHPGTSEYADHYTRAVVDLDVTYTGKAAHSAAAPNEGINAGDAATVAQVAIGLLRQHLNPGDLVHGIITKGGEAPNVVPSETNLLYDARANTIAELDGVKKRLRACFEAGATATGCSVDIADEWPAFSEFRNDDPMVDFYRANAEALGRTFTRTPMQQRLAEAGSTDMGNVSLAMPAIHPTIKVDAHGASNHQPEFARWCAEPDADQALYDGGVSMAWTAIDLATDDGQRARLLAGRDA